MRQRGLVPLGSIMSLADYMPVCVNYDCADGDFVYGGGFFCFLEGKMHVMFICVHDFLLRAKIDSASTSILN
jgi:hypothetical protein